MTNPPSDESRLAEQVARAVVRTLAPTLAEQLRRHQERITRLWLTPPIAARLVGCNDALVYAALHSGELTGSFNPTAGGGRGAWHIRRSDLDSWADRLRRPKAAASNPEPRE